MKVLFVAPRWQYKDPTRGNSVEYSSFWDSLRRMDSIEADFYPFDVIEAREGTEQMNKHLVRVVLETEPDLVFFFLYEDEFDPDTVRAVTAMTTSLNWFADDHWRFEHFSRVWAPNFTFIATTDELSFERYEKAGLQNALMSQWACNHHVYRPMSVGRDIEVSFVGQPHGDRRQMINGLRAAGVPVQTWGSGWPAGNLTDEDMIAVFSRSKVNLNLSNSSSPSGSLPVLKDLLRRRGHLIPSTRVLRRNFAELRGKKRAQIKGRNFEVPGCRGFLLSTMVTHLDRYYEIGQEIEVFDSLDELVEKCCYYADDDSRRDAIAARGYERTLRDHTYEQRFTSLFTAMGLL